LGGHEKPPSRKRDLGYLAVLARKATEIGTLSERVEILDSILRQRKDNRAR
jgi:hypothetical protein